MTEHLDIRHSAISDIPRLHEIFAHARQFMKDTHRDNRVMQNIILRYGFEYCGIIHCWNGDERLAYQFTNYSEK